MKYVISGNFFKLPPWNETLPDMMDGIIDSTEKLVEGNIGLAIAKLAAVVMRPILPYQNNDEAIVWKLLIRSALKAWRDFATSVIPQDIEGFQLPEMWDKSGLSKKTKEYLQTFDACTIDREFFDAPGDSEIADCLMEVLCESLQGVVEKSENIISEFRGAWPRLFSYAVEAEYAAHLEQYSPLFNKLNTPMATYNQQLKAKHHYCEELLRWKSECVFGEESVHNEDIYIPLIARSETAEVFSYQYDSMPEYIDLDQYLVQWALGEVPLSVPDRSHETVWRKQLRKIIGGDQRLFIIHGEPGSGKSTVLKHFAMRLVEEHLTPIFVSLKEVPFSQYPNNYIAALSNHIKKNFPWILGAISRNSISRSDTIVILDGLDEITGKVWDSAKKIIEDLDQLPWGSHVRVLISGRTQLITKCVENLQNAQIYQINPLVKGIQEELWEKLQTAFSFQIEFEEIDKHLHLQELLDKPLLMFLIAWLQKNSEKSILSIKNTSDLYNTIIECLYYRRHSGQYLNPAKYQDYRTVLEMLGRTAQKSNSNVANINDVKTYAEATNRKELFDKWINSSSITTSKLLLAFFGFANKESMSISFYHRSFVEFLAIEDLSNQLMFLPQDLTKGPEGIEKLNKLFDQYNLFHGEDSHIEDFWLGRLEFISENNEKFKTLIRILGVVLTYVDKSELSENSRQNILKAVVILFRFLEDRGLEMRLEPHSSLKNIHTFRSNIIPSLRMQQETGVEFCDFSNANISRLKLCSTVLLSDCYFNAAKIGCLYAYVLETEHTKHQSSNSVVQLHKLQCYATKFSSVDLTNTQIKECVFDGTEFIYNRWQRVDAKNVSFRYAFFKESEFCWVELNRADFSYLNIIQATKIEASAKFKLIASKILHSSFNNADLRGAEFVNVEIQDSTFQNAKLACSKWIRAKVGQDDREHNRTSGSQHRGENRIGQKYTKEDEHIMSLSRVDFTNADLSFAKFDRGIVFVDCIMKGAKLDGVSMVDFDLTKANIIQMLSEADLHNVNWNGAEKFKSCFEGL